MGGLAGSGGEECSQVEEEVGDLLFSVNNRELTSLDDLQRVREVLQPGRNAALLLRRGNAMLYVSVPIPSGE